VVVQLILSLIRSPSGFQFFQQKFRHLLDPRFRGDDEFLQFADPVDPLRFIAVRNAFACFTFCPWLKANSIRPAKTTKGMPCAGHALNGQIYKFLKRWNLQGRNAPSDL